MPLRKSTSLSLLANRVGATLARHPTPSDVWGPHPTFDGAPEGDGHVPRSVPDQDRSTRRCHLDGVSGYGYAGWVELGPEPRTAMSSAGSREERPRATTQYS